MQGKIIAIVAAIGILINTVTALLFFRDREKDINIKSAYLHLMSDAIVSLGLVIGGIVMLYTNWFWFDSLLSVVIAVVILLSTWRLLKDSLRLSLDGVPENISIDNIKATAIKVEGVQDIHHIHIWAISTTENALTAHIIVDEKISLPDTEEIKHKLKHELQHINIQHITLQIESKNCEEKDC